jgi:stage II sporulation protein D
MSSKAFTSPRIKCAALALAVLMLSLAAMPRPIAMSGNPNPIVRVGLAFGSQAREEANLQNVTGNGRGYRFGFFDENRVFHQTGQTQETDITMIRGNSATAVTVVHRYSRATLHTHDMGQARPLAVMPDTTGHVRPLTWFNNQQYAGGFEYRRDGGNITVINVVPMQCYLKGVLPHEMGPTWPIEALKAQAVASKAFVLHQAVNGRHRTVGFDVCNITCCQVYNGARQENANMSRAVDETFGVFVVHNGQHILAVFHASNGGSTENSENIWTQTLPYLRAVTDNFENLARANRGIWSTSFTLDDMTEILRERGHIEPHVTVVNVEVSQFTQAGNVHTLTFTDSTGRRINFPRESARTILNQGPRGVQVRSQRFTIIPRASLSVINATGNVTAVSAVGTLSALSSGGRIMPLPPLNSIAILSASGLSGLTFGDTFVIEGRGWGHNLGMSQEGARGMAEQGYSFRQILMFYYTGVDIVTMG